MLKPLLWVGLALTLTACAPEPTDLLTDYMTSLQAGDNSKARKLSCVPNQFQSVQPNTISDWQILMQLPKRYNGINYTQAIVRVDMPDGIGTATLTWELWIWKPGDAYKHYQSTHQNQPEAEDGLPTLTKADWSTQPRCISHQHE